MQFKTGTCETFPTDKESLRLQNEDVTLTERSRKRSWPSVLSDVLWSFFPFGRQTGCLNHGRIYDPFLLPPGINSFLRWRNLGWDLDRAGLTLGDEQIHYNSQPSFKPPRRYLACVLWVGVRCWRWREEGFVQLGQKSNIYDRASVCFRCLIPKLANSQFVFRRGFINKDSTKWSPRFTFTLIYI